MKQDERVNILTKQVHRLLGFIKQQREECDQLSYMIDYYKSQFIEMTHCYENVVKSNSELLDELNRVKRENKGLKTSLSNMREKEAKFFGNMNVRG